MISFPDVCYGFIIDTNEYAGNFEREMCAFATGQLGECGVGEKDSNLFVKEMGEGLLEEFSYRMVHLPDDHGCSRPCSVWDGNGKDAVCNSVIIFFSEIPPNNLIKIIKERSEAFTKRPKSGKFKILGYRMLKIETIFTKLGDV